MRRHSSPSQGGGGGGGQSLLNPSPSQHFGIIFLQLSLHFPSFPFIAPLSHSSPDSIFPFPQNIFSPSVTQISLRSIEQFWQVSHGSISPFPQLSGFLSPLSIQISLRSSGQF